MKEGRKEGRKWSEGEGGGEGDMTVGYYDKNDVISEKLHFHFLGE